MHAECSKENAINFLLFSYFGITLDDKKEAIIEAVIKKAYDDATLQGAYNTKITSDDLKDQSRKARKKGIRIIKDNLNKLFYIEFKEYDDWHIQICKSLLINYNKAFKKIIPDEPQMLFSYGNAQKWVNMTIKYLYILNTIFEMSGKDRLFSKVDDMARNLHVPVDRYIIRAVWSYSDVELPTKPKAVRTNRYKDPVDLVTPWSQWDNTPSDSTDENNLGTYSKFQKTLRKYVKPKNNATLIDWECSKWIKQSKKEKKNKERALKAKENT